MKIRRKSRARTRGSWTKEGSRRAHAAKARKRLARMAEGWVEDEPLKVPEGTPLGVLTWQSADGSVRRWVICQGTRANNIGVVARVAGGDDLRRVMGWDKLLRGLRKRLAVPKRLWPQVAAAAEGLSLGVESND
jgi:hypothetical protein